METLAPTLDEILKGLNVFELAPKIRKDPESFELVFCHSDVLEWTYDEFINTLKVMWSEEGSNYKRKELCVFGFFMEMCELSFHDGK